MDANVSIDVWTATALLPLAVVAGGMLAATVLVSVVEAITVRLVGASPWSWSPAPRALRRLVFAVCGLSLVVALPGAADATPGHGHEPRPAARACAARCSSLDGLRLPDLPVPLPDVRRGTAARSSVVVRRGDCLWSLTADLIGPGADASAVAAAAHALYRGNRQRIGPDPNLIFPGTHLTLPEVLR
jgi:nucleoid-associated protein YgaU